MLTFSANSKIYLSIGPVDFRNQIRGLKKWIRRELEMDPLSSAYFIFISKNKKSIKVIQYDGQGTWLHQKLLSEGQFKWWSGPYDISKKYVSIHPTASQVLVMNGNSNQLDIQRNWNQS